MLYDANGFRKLFKDLGAPLTDDKFSKFKLQKDEVELEEEGTRVLFPKHLLNLRDAKKLLESFKNNGIKSVVILDKSGKSVAHIEDQKFLDKPDADADGYSFSCSEVDLFKIFNLSVSGDIKKATLAETSASSPKAVSLAQSASIPDAAPDVRDDKKLKKNYFNLYSQFFEMFKTERNYRHGLEVSAEVLKKLKASDNHRLDKTLITAFEGAIQKALSASTKMFETIQQIKDSFPAELNSKWEILTKEIDELSAAIPREMDLQKKKDKNEQLALLKKQREELSDKIFEAIEGDLEIFDKLKASITKVEENYAEYHAGFRDAKVLNTIINRNQTQFDLWKDLSSKMKETAGSTQGVFDFTKLPIQRSGQYELYLKAIGEHTKEISHAKKNSGNVASFEKANKSALEQVAKDAKAANTQQVLDNIIIIHTEKLPKIVSMKKFAEQLANKIDKIKSRKGKTPSENKELNDLTKYKEMLEDIVKNRKSLIAAKTVPEKRFRERTEAAVAAAVALENAYFFYNNTSPKTKKDMENINHLVKDFNNKFKELAPEERKMLDALGKIEPLKDHLLMNPILNNAQKIANDFSNKIFHDHVRGQKYAEAVIKEWSPQQVNTALNHEKFLALGKKDELSKEYVSINNEFRIKLNKLDNDLHTLTQKIRGKVYIGDEQKKPVIDEITKMQKNMGTLIKDLETKQRELLAKESAFFDPIINDHLKEHKASIKSSLEMAASQLLQVKATARSKIKDLEKEQLDIESNRIMNMFHNLTDMVNTLQKRVGKSLELLGSNDPEKIRDHLEKSNLNKDLKEIKHALSLQKNELLHTFKHVPEKLSQPVHATIGYTLNNIAKIENLLESRHKLEIPIQKFVEKYRNGVYFQEYKDAKKQPLDPKVFLAIQKVIQKHIDLKSQAKNNIESLKKVQEELSQLKIDNKNISDVPAAKFICAKINVDLEHLFNRTATVDRTQKPEKRTRKGSH